jgi:phosphatidylglycerophosphatase A
VIGHGLVTGRGLAFWHPASLLATWFGAGLLPRAPGTWGSLAALPFAYAIVAAAGPWALLAAAGAVFLAGLWASGIYAAALGTGDPGSVVIDEVAGQWLALVPLATTAMALDPLFYGIAFAAFRVFDVLKPWPVSIIDRRLPGAWGIMGDDIAAGIYAGLLTFILAAIFAQ